MEWPPALGEGYHYMKLEGKFDSTDLVKNYQGPYRTVKRKSLLYRSEPAKCFFFCKQWR